MASHWYIMRDGSVSRYTQTNKDGSESKVIRRGRALADGAVEGLTSILARVFDQAGLIEWAGRLGIEAGVRAALEAANAGQTREAIADLARTYYDAERERAANRGSELHDAIERYIAHGQLSADPIEAAAQRAVADWHKANGIGLGRTEHCVMFRGVIPPFDTPCAFGGTVDWIGQDCLLDYKTVEPDKRGKYWTGKASHCAQLAGYRLAAAQMELCSPDARCINLYISRLTGDIVAVREWTAADLTAGVELVALACRATTLTEEIGS